MVTFAQAQERAEEWINGDVPAYQHREVRVREFELGFVVWAEDREGGVVSDGGRQRLVIARDSAEATLWPGLPVGEVIRRYEEEYGLPEAPAGPAAPRPPERVDLNQTSFLLSPPEWLQEAADKLGIAGGGASDGADEPQDAVPAAASAPPPPPPPPAPVPADATPWAGTDTNGMGDENDRLVPLPDTVFSPPPAEDAKPDPAPAGGQLPPPPPPPPANGFPQAGSNTPPPPASSPPPPPAAGPVGAPLPPPVPGTAVPVTPPPGAVSAYGYPQGSAPAPGRDAAGRPLAPDAEDIANAATSKAQPPRKSGAQTPPPPGSPGVPGGGYVPTQMLSAPGAGQPEPPAAPQPPPPGAGVHHAATMLSGPPVAGPGAPGTPPPPGPPGPAGGPGMPPPPGPPGPPPPPAPSGDAVHHAATMLSGPGPQAPGGMQPPPGAMQPPPPGAMQQPGGMPPGAMPPPVPGQQIPGGPPPAYGYPQTAPAPGPPAGPPTVGPGYQAVLRYRAPDGSEQQLIRRSAPGVAHPEWQIFHELRGMNIPPDQVLELHTELESCALPGAYCSRMIQEQWPQARITSIAPYGTDHASRQQGMQQLIAHQGELHQVADGPARPAPVRAPLPPAQPAPPIPPEGIAQELAAAFGPGVFRFDQRAVSRQGVPDVVAHTLVVAGLPADFGPFFWAQAQPGRPVPTLAELAQERGVQPAPDAGSYLVMGSDFGKALCVQYGTANIVAVPVEAGPGGAPVPPQFVNSGLPEFARSLALLGRMWRLRYGLNPEQAGRWTVDFQAQLSALDPAALGSPETWWSVLLEQMWDGLL
ncbi:SUKH-4 family immunity protein [Streptomyces sp. NPDC059639]|uniref:SUKH-4 family immunity protein n=1 Tax=Streptomyces sp. NPDC059639 TaxID=3346891 RepID=UPI0036C1E681